MINQKNSRDLSQGILRLWFQFLIKIYIYIRGILNFHNKSHLVKYFLTHQLHWSYGSPLSYIPHCCLSDVMSRNWSALITQNKNVIYGQTSACALNTQTQCHQWTRHWSSYSWYSHNFSMFMWIATNHHDTMYKRSTNVIFMRNKWTEFSAIYN